MKCCIRCTLDAIGFSCAVSDFAARVFGLRSDTCRPAANKTKLPVAREKKPLVPRVYWVMFALRFQMTSARHSFRHPLFSSTHARIQPRYQCTSTRSRPCRTLNIKYRVPVFIHFLLVSRKSTSLHTHNFLLRSSLKMASSRVKQGKYLHSGTTVPLSAATRHQSPVISC